MLHNALEHIDISADTYDNVIRIAINIYVIDTICDQRIGEVQRQ